MKLRALLVVVLASCSGGEDSQVRVTLDLEFEVRGADTDNDGTLVDQKAVSTDVGEPWQIFRDELDVNFSGHPGALVLESVSMQLLESSSGVSDLGDVFNGPIGYRLRTDRTSSEYSLAVADIRDESTATAIDSFLIEFDYGRIDDGDREQIIDGAIEALFVGQASDDFRDTPKEAAMAVGLVFVASPAVQR